MLEKLERIKRTGTIILLSGALAFTLGCSKKEDKVIIINKEPETTTLIDYDNVPTNSDTVIINEVHPDMQKSFAPGEHLVREYQNIRNDILHNTDGYSIKSGYQLIDIVPKLSSGSTRGYYLYYVNDEEVMVKGTWNEETQQYEFDSFGEVMPNMEKEKGFSK